jgi:phage host-nuclease inhibitor protein Gam
MSDPPNRHPLAPTTAQRDTNHHYSQQLINLQAEIMTLTRTIDETAAEHKRQCTTDMLMAISITDAGQVKLQLKRGR